MAKFVEYDPARGMGIYEDMYDNHLQVHYREDVEGVLELNKYERNNQVHDKGIKQEFWHYARIPAVIIMKLKIEHGIDIFDKNDFKKSVEVINRDYPYLKTTDKHHTVSH